MQKKPQWRYGIIDGIVTPFGIVRVFLDGKTIPFDMCSVPPHERFYPDVDRTYRIIAHVKPDGAPHELSIRLLDCKGASDIEPGELLEAISFFSGYGKITFGCYASFGNPEDYRLDYDGNYLPDGLSISTTPFTETESFRFGVCWVNECRKENVDQTWNGVDPFLWDID